MTDQNSNNNPVNVSKKMMPSAEANGIATVLQKKYAAFATDRSFSCESWSDNQTVYLTITLKNNDASFFYPVEGRIAWRDEGLNTANATSLLLDLMDNYFQEFLINDGEVYLPIDWQDYDFENHTMQLRGQVKNLKLETMADDILAGQITPQNLR